ESADANAERDFMNEIGTMKIIGYHERLVNILACVIRSEPIFLISEYCEKGNLLEHMKKRRHFILENPDEDDNTFKKQIMFAVQIAFGLVRE
ncbi:hypothetical protein PMAYCL1PPCAC_22088, partial [Pristionchus mayeri]